MTGPFIQGLNVPGNDSVKPILKPHRPRGYTAESDTPTSKLRFEDNFSDFADSFSKGSIHSEDAGSPRFLEPVSPKSGSRCRSEGRQSSSYRSVPGRMRASTGSSRRSVVSIKRVEFTLDEILLKIGRTKRHYWIMFVCSVCYASYSIQLLIQTLCAESLWAQWPEISPNANRGDLKFNVLYFLTGGFKILGALFFIPLIDIFGRRRMLLLATFLLLGFNCIAAFSPTFSFFCAIRALTYAILPVINTTAAIYQLELMSIKSRTLPGLITQLSGTTGQVVISAIWWAMADWSTGGALDPDNHWFSSWRLLLLASTIPSLFSFVALWLSVPYETPRYLYAQGREERVWKTLARLTSGGAPKLAECLGLPSLDHGKISYHSGWTAPRRDQTGASRASGRDTASVPGSQAGRRGIDVSTFGMNAWRGTKAALNLLIDPHYRAIAWTISCLWFLQAFGYWGVTSYLPTFFKSIGLRAHPMTLASFASEYPGMLLAFLLMRKSPYAVPAETYDTERGGVVIAQTEPSAKTDVTSAPGRGTWSIRRYAFGRLNAMRIFSCAASLVLVMFALGVSLLSSGHPFLYVPSLLAYFFVAPIWPILYTYSPEVFPTEIRGTGIALTGIANGIPQMFTYFIGSQMKSNGTIYTTVWAIIFFILFLISVIFLKDETAMKSLKDFALNTAPTNPPCSQPLKDQLLNSGTPDAIDLAPTNIELPAIRVRGVDDRPAAGEIDAFTTSAS